MTRILSYARPVELPIDKIVAHIGLILSVAFVTLVIVLPISVVERGEDDIRGLTPVVFNDFAALEER